jgi:hypothetical protein
MTKKGGTAVAASAPSRAGVFYYLIAKKEDIAMATIPGRWPRRGHGINQSG